MPHAAAATALAAKAARAVARVTKRHTLPVLATPTGAATVHAMRSTTTVHVARSTRNLAAVAAPPDAKVHHTLRREGLANPLEVALLVPVRVARVAQQVPAPPVATEATEVVAMVATPAAVAATPAAHVDRHAQLLHLPILLLP